MNKIQFYTASCLMMFIIAMSNAQSKTLSLKDSVFHTSQSFIDIDTLIINNCTFSDIDTYAIFIQRANHVVISQCEFKRINATKTGTNHGVVGGNGLRFFQMYNCVFDSIQGTALRFPAGGTTEMSDRNGNVIITSCRLSNIKKNNNYPGNGFLVFHTRSVYLIGNTIKNIESNGIVIGRNSTASDQELQKVEQSTVQGNRIDSALGNGIVICENAYETQIKDNIIFNIAYDGKGMESLEGDHGIYWQAKGGIIQNNAVLFNNDGDSSGNPGSGISIRSNAKVTQNTVGFCSGNGIGYYADHDSKGNMHIINNVVFQNARNGVYFNASQVSGKQPDTILLLHNTIVNEPVQTLLHQSCPIAFNEMKSTSTIAGNYCVYTTITNPFDYIRILGTTKQPRIEYTLLSSHTNDFINPDIGDFHLLSDSKAINYANHGIPISIDREGWPRIGLPDAGAFEYQGIVSVEHDNTSKRTFGIIDGMIKVNDIEDFERIQICSLDGKKVSYDIERNGGELTIYMKDYKYTQPLFMVIIYNNEKTESIKILPF